MVTKDDLLKKYKIVGDFIGGLAKVKKGYGYGFVNTEGELVVPCEYDLVGDFINGFAWVNKGGVCGYIDKNGVFYDEKAISM